MLCHSLLRSHWNSMMPVWLWTDTLPHRHSQVCNIFFVVLKILAIFLIIFLLHVVCIRHAFFYIGTIGLKLLSFSWDECRLLVWSYFANSVSVNFGLFFVKYRIPKGKDSFSAIDNSPNFEGHRKDTEDSHCAGLIDVVVPSAVVVPFPATHHHASLKAGESNKYVYSGLATVGAECQPWTSDLIPDLIQSWMPINSHLRLSILYIYMRSHYQQHKSLLKKMMIKTWDSPADASDVAGSHVLEGTEELRSSEPSERCSNVNLVCCYIRCTTLCKQMQVESLLKMFAGKILTIFSCVSYICK